MQTLDSALSVMHHTPDHLTLARFFCDSILPKMDALRAAIDEAEELTASDYWPFPTYGDLLFGVR